MTNVQRIPFPGAPQNRPWTLLNSISIVLLRTLALSWGRNMTDTDSYRGRLQDPARASRYATRFERGSRRRIDRREQRAVRKIFAELNGCRRVLDVPSGTGRFLAALAQDNREVIEMDVALEILEFGRQRAAKLGLRAEFMPGDACHLPLSSNSIDVIFCNRLLHHITSAPERAVFLNEFHRVTRRYVVVSFFDYLAFGALRRFLKSLKGRKVTYEGQPTLEEFRREVTQSGFRVWRIVSTGPLWVSEKYFVLEKTGAKEGRPMQR